MRYRQIASRRGANSAVVLELECAHRNGDIHDFVEILAWLINGIIPQSEQAKALSSQWMLVGMPAHDNVPRA